MPLAAKVFATWWLVGFLLGAWCMWHGPGHWGSKMPWCFRVAIAWGITGVALLIAMVWMS